jgi:hypothetical protein
VRVYEVDSFIHKKFDTCAIGRNGKILSSPNFTGKKISSDEGMTPRVLDIDLPASAQEQHGHSKSKKPKTN